MVRNFSIDNDWEEVKRELSTSVSQNSIENVELFYYTYKVELEKFNCKLPFPDVGKFGKGVDLFWRDYAGSDLLVHGEENGNSISFCGIDAGENLVKGSIKKWKIMDESLLKFMERMFKND